MFETNCLPILLKILHASEQLRSPYSPPTVQYNRLFSFEYLKYVDLLLSLILITVQRKF
jgi:hypothetical protein